MEQDHLCQHYEVKYKCKKCRKKQKDCEHEDCVSRWKYEGDKLIDAWGFCYDCGKGLKLNKERNLVE